MTQDIITELKVCKNPDCKKEYEAHILNLLGARIVRGGGNCPDCAKKILERWKEEGLTPLSDKSTSKPIKGLNIEQ